MELKIKNQELRCRSYKWGCKEIGSEPMIGSEPNFDVLEASTELKSRIKM